MEQVPGAAFEAVYDSGVAGLVGSVEVAIQDNDGNVVFGPTAAGIIELLVSGSPTGTYSAELTAPSDEGQFTILWSNDGSFDPGTGAAEDLIVSLAAALTLPSLGAGVEDSILCNAWTTSEDVLACCESDNIDSSAVLLDSSIVAASETLYLASGKRYPGVCEITVRPCDPNGLGCGVQVLSRGHLVGWDGYWWGNFDCGCTPISRVKLAGRVREILEVKIDGAVVDEDLYAVKDKRWLVRTDGLRWPRCQSEAPDTEEGTFSVTYTYGKAPPVAGQLAAARLACELIKSCLPGVECALPQGVTRVTRQGITVERSYFVRNRDGVWVTGMGEVDYFLNSVNPAGIQRRATVMSLRSRFARPEAV